MSNTELLSIIENHCNEVNNIAEPEELLDQLNEMLCHTHIQPQHKLSHNGVAAVEKILGDKNIEGHRHFHIKWAGEHETTWIPIENVSRYTLQLYNLQKEAEKINKTIISPTHTACLYLRTSKARVHDGQVSLEVQKSDMIKYCTDNNIHIKSITFDEGISARNMEKLEGLNNILNEIVPHDILMVWDISRFSRNTHQALYLLEELSAKSIDIFFFKENLSYSGAMGKHHIRLALSAAQLHSDTVSEKVKAAIQYKKSKGNYVGGRPKFGYKVQKINGIRSVTTSTREQKDISLIKTVCNSYKNKNGLCKLQKNHLNNIANMLNTKHMRFRGKLFTHKNVSLVLKR